MTMCSVWPGVTSDQVWSVSRCDQILFVYIGLSWSVASDQVWPVFRCDYWTDVTSDQFQDEINSFVTRYFLLIFACHDHLLYVTKSDQVWPVTRCDQWPDVILSFLWLLLFCDQFAICDQAWPGVTSDQVWPVTRCDQWPGVTSGDQLPDVTSPS